MPDGFRTTESSKRARLAMATSVLASHSKTFEVRVAFALSSVLLILVAGTTGYMLIEGASFFDSLYMTAITVTTVGYAEVFPLGTGGRVFTVFVALIGVGAILYVASLMAEYVISGQLGGMIGQRRMNRQIAGLNGHYVICGYGRTGRRVSEELKRDGHDIVIIDSSESKVAQAINDGYLAMLGDSGSDDILRQAGVERATGLVAAVAPDSVALMAVLSAHALNRDLHIVAKAEYEDSESKMITAGADRVISVYRMAGHRMAQMVTRPELSDFIDVVLHDHNVEIEMDMVRLADNSVYDESSLAESGILSRTSVNIVGIRKFGSTLTAQATPGTKLNSGDVLLAIGSRTQLDALKREVAAAKS